MFAGYVEIIANAVAFVYIIQQFTRIIRKQKALPKQCFSLEYFPVHLTVDDGNERVRDYAVIWRNRSRGIRE